MNWRFDVKIDGLWSTNATQVYATQAEALAAAGAFKARYAPITDIRAEETDAVVNAHIVNGEERPGPKPVQEGTK